MLSSVADVDSVRRQNRGLVLATLRQQGPMSRTQLAGATGLSHASITAIGGELIHRKVLLDSGEAVPVSRTRGRPAVQVRFNRDAAHAIIIELDVNYTRLSLVDYAGTLVDRIEHPVTPTTFGRVTPPAFLRTQIDCLRSRNPHAAATLKRIDISVQGVLDPDGDRLKWTPIPGLAGQSLVAPLTASFGTAVSLNKRGWLLAAGTRALCPETRDHNIAAVFLGSTVAMGMSQPGRTRTHGEDGATEFGHMNHLPDGARCRCGMRGCIEAYAADYGVLRTAQGAADRSPPAPALPAADFDDLLRLGRTGRPNAVRAFNLAGRAIGYGLARLMTIAPPAHIVIVGPGARAYDLMRGEIEAALGASLVCRINGIPAISVHHDERELIYQGMLVSTLSQLDDWPLPAGGAEAR